VESGPGALDFFVSRGGLDAGPTRARVDGDQPGQAVGGAKCQRKAQFDCAHAARAHVGIAIAQTKKNMIFCIAVVLLSIAAVGEANGMTLAPQLLVAVWLSCTLYVFQIVMRGVLSRRMRATQPVLVRQETWAREAIDSVGVRS
jgi:hypothetical protein